MDILWLNCVALWATVSRCRRSAVNLLEQAQDCTSCQTEVGYLLTVDHNLSLPPENLSLSNIHDVRNDQAHRITREDDLMVADLPRR
ncbi:hypothetical protein IG631_15422 [Alternaria alternata]|nr:hypothetical protein IG631_15422 [Alternaria alternata]